MADLTVSRSICQRTGLPEGRPLGKGPEPRLAVAGLQLAGDGSQKPFAARYGDIGTLVYDMGHAVRRRYDIAAT